MKRLWKRINRGLLLGALLLSLFGGYVVVKEVQFRAEAPEACDVARASVEALLSLNVPQESAVLGRVRDGEEQRRDRARMEEMLATYWDADAVSEYYLNVESVRAGYEALLKEPVRMRAREIELEIPAADVSIRRNGTDYAIVTVEINNLSIRYDGDGESVFFGEYYGGEEIGIQLGSYLGAYHGYAELEMHRSNGEWRVCGMSGWLELRGKTVVKTEGGDV